MTRLFLICVLLVALVTVAPTCENKCTSIQNLTDYTTPTKLAVGDSILAVWKDSCEDVISDTSFLGSSYVLNKAVGGARLSADTVADIRSQYTTGPWKYIVIDGGANDLMSECSTNPLNELTCDQSVRCNEIVNELANEMQMFVNTILTDGDPIPKIILLGYYQFKENALYRYDLCQPYINVLNTKYQALTGITFMPTMDLMNPVLYPDRFMDDGVHPSVIGAGAIAKRLSSLLK